MELNLLEDDLNRSLEYQFLDNIDLQFYHLDKIDELKRQYKKTLPYTRSDKLVVQEMFNLRIDEHEKQLTQLRKKNIKIDTKINSYDNHNN